jgi:hypothetical protein
MVLLKFQNLFNFTPKLIKYIVSKIIALQYSVCQIKLTF